MIIRRYCAHDFSQIRTWLTKRGMKVIHPRVLSKTGFIVDDVACVFLYKTDSDFSYLENLFSNPDSEPDVRDKAISRLVDIALAEAKDQGFKFTLAVTKHPAVIKRAIQLGAHVEAGQALLTKQHS